MSNTNTRTVGVIGAGLMARTHAHGWAAEGVALRIWSRGAPARESLAHDVGAEPVESLAALLDGADLVDVCTPTPTHPEFVRAAIAAHVPVLCEKPLARTAADAEALVEDIRAAGVPVFPAHVIRWFPEYAAAHARIADGGLGEVAVARFLRSGEYPSWGAWIGDEAQSGGIILDQMIHDLDAARWLLGEVETVHAVQRYAESSPARSAHVLMRHVGGAISSATGVWGAAGVEFATRFSVAGTGGTIEHDSRDRGTMHLDFGPRERGSAAVPAAGGADPYRSQLAEILAAAVDGAPARVSLDDGLQAVRIATAALTSLGSGDPVEVTR